MNIQRYFICYRTIHINQQPDSALALQGYISTLQAPPFPLQALQGKLCTALSHPGPAPAANVFIRGSISGLNEARAPLERIGLSAWPLSGRDGNTVDGYAARVRVNFDG